MPKTTDGTIGRSKLTRVREEKSLLIIATTSMLWPGRFNRLRRFVPLRQITSRFSGSMHSLSKLAQAYCTRCMALLGCDRCALRAVRADCAIPTSPRKGEFSKARLNRLLAMNLFGLSER